MALSHVLEAARAVCGWAAGSDHEAAAAYGKLLHGLDWSAPPQVPTGILQPPVTRWLESAMQNLAPGPLGDLGRAVRENAEILEWIMFYGEYGDTVPEEFRHFRDNYAIARIAGRNGPVLSMEQSFAVTVQGPGTFYPDHAHKQEEVYGVIAGTAEWRRGAEPWIRRPPGDLILHTSGIRHATRTGDEALLSLAAWTHDALLPVVIVTG